MSTTITRCVSCHAPFETANGYLAHFPCRDRHRVRRLAASVGLGLVLVAATGGGASAAPINHHNATVACVLGKAVLTISATQPYREGIDVESIPVGWSTSTVQIGEVGAVDESVQIILPVWVRTVRTRDGYDPAIVLEVPSCYRPPTTTTTPATTTTAAPPTSPATTSVPPSTMVQIAGCATISTRPPECSRLPDTGQALVAWFVSAATVLFMVGLMMIGGVRSARAADRKATRFNREVDNLDR